MQCFPRTQRPAGRMASPLQSPVLLLAVSNVYLTDDVMLSVLRLVQGGSSVSGCPSIYRMYKRSEGRPT